MVINLIISFVIAVISGLGIGGGGLFTVYLALVGDLPQLASQGLNLLFFLFSAGASVVVILLRRRVYFPAVGVMIVGGIAGVMLGTLGTSVLPEEWIRKLFAVVLMTGGVLSLRATMKGGHSKNPSSENDVNSQNGTDNGKSSDEK